MAGLGVVSAGVATLGGSRTWVGEIVLGGDAAAAGTGTLGLSHTGTGDVPGVVAAGLVLLAAWGLVLFSRRRVRRLAAWIGAIAAVGLVAAVVHGRLTLRDQAEQSRARLPAGATLDLSWTAWFPLTAAAAVVALVTAVAAALWCAHWPEMGSRYDAPTGDAGPAEVGEDATSLDLWKAIDAGHDPTSGPTG